jgi:hypothetical protein
MAEDDDISKRYRELPREEPPRHLDDAIRAAARRAVHTRRQRWYFPLAAAAIIVLAVAVTMQVEREQPREEMASAPAAPAAPAEEPKAERKIESADSRALRDAAPPRQPQRAQEPAAILQENQTEASKGTAEVTQSARAPQAPPPPLAGAAPPQASAELRRSDEGARAAASVSAYALQSPEQWLQGIVDLRRQGRHEEADKSLAEFRKRYPDYRISKERLEQLEKR